jgi:hypothetical protein
VSVSVLHSVILKLTSSCSGISVGSLGQCVIAKHKLQESMTDALKRYAGVYDIVQNVMATNIKMVNAQNGARIKAFAGSGVGSGLVKNSHYSSDSLTNDHCTCSD